MIRQSANPSSSRRRPLSRPTSSFCDEADDTVRVLLVAIHHGPQPAAFLGSNPLQRLQVMLAEPGEKIEFDPLNRMPGASPQLLPPISPATCDFQRPPRLVQGEILSDDDGRLYERIGHRIRPLNRLFSGPRGEVLELPPEVETEHPSQPSPTQSFNAEASRQAMPLHNQQPVSGRQPHVSAQPEPQRPTYRQLEPQQRIGNPINPAPNGPKKMIPERWIKPWEFQISREEAMYDMQLKPSFRSTVAALFGNRRSWRKWQALLAGKSLDEQLWAVRPPEGRLAQPSVREWARRTLAQAGYDENAMVAEWEIFWRRKGM